MFVKMEVVMTMVDLAKNLKRLRAAKGLSQKVLGKESGVPLSAIQGIELQRGQPQIRAIQAIATALDVRLEILFRPVRELSGVRFRSEKRLRNRSNILAKVSRWLDDYAFLEKILEKKTPFSLANIDRPDDVKEFAGICRERLGLGPGEPVDDIFGLLEDAGIKVFPLTETDSEGFFGLSVSEANGGPAVIVNVWDKISVERRIFSAAHEFGHLMMHLDAYDVAKENEDESEEGEADRFAGHFLMPDQEFKKQYEDNKGLNLYDMVCNIKKNFHVSYKTVLHRLIELKKENKSIWWRFQQILHQEFGRSFQSNEEPNGLREFDFREGIFNSLAKEAFEKDLISQSRCAELLQISIEEIRELL
jgi:Zn-dependent peptidase ImmA (M78 family)/DNA-binding XRE family transcriptional regulator